MLGLPFAQLLGGDRIRQRAAGVGVGDQHALVGTQDRGRLGHEVHTAEDDRVAVGLGRALRQPQRIADVISDVLDLRELVVVGEDHGVALVRERPDLFLQGRDVLE